MSTSNNQPLNTNLIESIIDTTNSGVSIIDTTNSNLSTNLDAPSNIKKKFAEYILNGNNETSSLISPLVRSTHRYCDNKDFCGKCVSCYSHNYCFICCLLKKDSKEYLHHYT
jgi:hypothetical protein